MSDILSKLSHNHCLLTKTWLKDGTIKPYDLAKYFSLEEIEVHDIHELSDVLFEMESDKYSCLIRGQFIGVDAAREFCPETLEGKIRRVIPVFQDAKKHQILIEVDNFKPENHDPILDPEGSAEEFIAKHLPKEFAVASFHWQLSSSAGHPTKAGIFKAHLWFWSEVPVSCEELTAWAKAYPEVDASVFRVVQINYTANPVFADGVSDPVPVRSGFVDGISDAVVLNLEVLPLNVSTLQRGTRLDVIDERLDRLEEKGVVNGYTNEGYALIDCPNSANHSSDSGPTQTVYMPAGTNGEAFGHYRCLHEHCSHLTDSWFDKHFDIYVDDFTIDDFDALADEVVESVMKDEEGVKGKDRFRPIQVAEFMNQKLPEWIIKNTLAEGEVAVIYGESGSGKSFLALDMAFAIARGINWNDKKVKQGRVAYIAAEGEGGVKKRARAYAQHNGVDSDMARFPLDIIPACPNFLTGDDSVKVAQAILESGDRPRVIIVDTLAQVAPGGDENTSKDMGGVLSRCKALHRATGALVVLIAHTGKDESRGIRGWSGIRGALDTNILVSRDGDSRSFTIDKQKDGEDGECWGFRLVPVVIGIDEDGEDITSCVFELTGLQGVQKKAQTVKKKKTIKSEIGAHIYRTWEDINEGKPVPLNVLVDKTVVRIKTNAAVYAAQGDYTRKIEVEKDGKLRGRVTQALTRLEGRGIAERNEKYEFTMCEAEITE